LVFSASGSNITTTDGDGCTYVLVVSGNTATLQDDVTCPTTTDSNGDVLQVTYTGITFTVNGDGTSQFDDTTTEVADLSTGGSNMCDYTFTQTGTLQ